MVTGDEALRLAAGAVSWREVDGEVILLDAERGEYLGINPAGTLLWTMLARGTTPAALVAALQREFALPAARASADVEDFLADVRRRGLLA